MRGPITEKTARKLGGGFTMVGVVVLFSLGGHWLDGKLGSSPAFLLAGALLGGVGGFLHLVRVLAPELLPWNRRPDRDPPKPPKNAS